MVALLIILPPFLPQIYQKQGLVSSKILGNEEKLKIKK
jgi:hypothetical protein